jgi:hypothetical protein
MRAHTNTHTQTRERAQTHTQTRARAHTNTRARTNTHTDTRSRTNTNTRTLGRTRPGRSSVPSQTTHIHKQQTSTPRMSPVTHSKQAVHTVAFVFLLFARLHISRLLRLLAVLLLFHSVLIRHVQLCYSATRYGLHGRISKPNRGQIFRNPPDGPWAHTTYCKMGKAVGT